jgi:hypothetical protein
MNYLIVLFKNKKQRKIINKFNTFNRAKDFFKRKIRESESIIFEKLIENGLPVEHELAIVGIKNNKHSVLYKRDSVGRSVKVTLDNGEREIIELSPYNLEEQIFDIKNKKRIFFSEFIEKYLPKKNIKMLSKLNHKIIVQNEDKINLFSLKSEVDAERFMSILGSYFLESRRADTLFVRDINTSQRKYLYDLLINAGYSKQTLYRKFTTHPSKK